MEILIKKASVDPAFRALLLDKRAEAAREIDLALSAAETALLDAVPAAHIEQIIANTTVPNRHRRVFLGKVAALMLAALGVHLVGCGRKSEEIRRKPDAYQLGHVGGIRPGEFGPPIPEPRVSCDPEHMRRDPKSKRLRFKIIDQSPSSVLLAVTGDFPLPDGHVEVSFRGESSLEQPGVLRPSAWAYALRGETLRVRVEGGNGKTDWLVLRWMSRFVKPGKNKDDLLELPKPPYEPGEYVVGECMVYRIAKFSKEWRT